MKIKNLFFVLLLSVALPVLIKSQDCTLYFNLNSSELLPQSKTKLDRFIETAKAQKTQAITLVGYTDSTGTATANAKLAEKRNLSIKNYLIKNGLTNKFNPLEKGKKQSGTDLSLQRRVELFLINDKKEVYASTKDFLESKKPKAQKFTIPFDKATTIEGKKGTIVQFPAKCFTDAKGKPVTGPITIELKEYYSVADMLSENLATVSDGNLLITQGMINLKATSSAGELKLKPDSNLVISFPKIDEEKYKTFYGAGNVNGMMNWKIDEREKNVKPVSGNDIGFIVTPNGSIKITDSKTAAAYRMVASFNSKTGTFREVSKEELKELEEYINHFDEFYQTIKSNKLNYINCDRFVNSADAKIMKIRFEAENENLKYPVASLLFKKINSIMPMLNLSASVFEMQARFPANETAILLVYDFVDGKTLVYTSEIKLKEGTEKIKLVESSVEELNKIMNTFKN